MRVLVAVDGSNDARVALEMAIKFANSGGNKKGYHRLYIMHVGQPKKSPRLQLPFSSEKASNAKRSASQAEEEDLMDAKAVVDDVVSTMQSQLETVAFETLSSVGKPADELLAAAEKNQCQIIFIGRHGPTGNKKTLSHVLGLRKLGKVTEEIVDTAKHGVRVHVCEFGSEVVDVFPKRAVSDKERARYLKQATEMGLQQPDAVVSTFLQYDADFSNCLDVDEVKTMLTDMNIDPNDEVVAQILRAIDDDNSHTIEFKEFLQLFTRLKSAGYDINKALQAAAQHQSRLLSGSAGKQARRLSAEIKGFFGGRKRSDSESEEEKEEENAQ